MNPILLRAIRASAGGSTLWYLAGGAPTPTAVYQPIGAASLAASYVNLANPGTNDAAPGVAPTWASGTGWTLNGTTQYLTTGVIVGLSYTTIIRFSSATNVGRIIGANTGNRFGVAVGATRIYEHDGLFQFSPGSSTTGGVMAIAGANGYYNGTNEIALPGTTLPTVASYIGARNLSGTAATFYAGDIQAIAIYPTDTGHATWVPAVSTAAAALT